MLNLLVVQKRFATEKGSQYHIIYVTFQETQHGKLSRQAPFDEQVPRLSGAEFV